MKKIKLNRSIYSDDSVKTALHAFSTLAAITTRLEPEYIVLTVLESKCDEEQTIKEFENYVIGIENS